MLFRSYCVNGQLVRDKIGDHNIPDIKIFHDSKHYGKGAEQVYDELYDKMDEEQLQALGQLLDEHIDWSKEGKDGQPKYTKEQLKEIRDEIREAVLAAANAAGAGNVPGGVKRLIKDLTEPVMNWRELLQQQIESTIKSDFTWAKPSRRSWHMEIGRAHV